MHILWTDPRPWSSSQSVQYPEEEAFLANRSTVVVEGLADARVLVLLNFT